MKRGDIVVPTWGRRLGRGAKLQYKDIGIVVATSNIHIQVIVVRASPQPLQEAFVPKWYHCTHWQKVSDFVKDI